MSISWTRALREGIVTGSLASLLSTASLWRAGGRRGVPAAPVNATSHWVFGDRALREDAPSARHTLTGALIHHGACIFWGVLHARAWGAREGAKRLLPAAVGGATAAAMACFVDLRCTPQRLTPGFERRLSSAELARVYAWVAVGLALGSMLLHNSGKGREQDDRRAENGSRRNGQPPQDDAAH